MAIIKPNNNTISAITSLPAAIPTGKVLQVVTATDGTQRNTTSTSFVTASNTLSVDITPSSSSNKIFVICTCTFGSNGNNIAGLGTIYRDSTNLGNANGMMANYGNSNRISGSMSILDSPSTTSSVTYQAYFRQESASGQCDINWNSTKSSITAYEIEG